MASALRTAISYCESVKMATPALPSDWAIAYAAASQDTCSGSVVTLLNSPADAIGPDSAPACQPTTGILRSVACLMAADCSVASKPPSTMPLGLSAIAWLSALVRPWALPLPSITSTFQPIAAPASVTALPTVLTPPLVRSAATYAILLPFFCAAGPVLGGVKPAPPERLSATRFL